jgi:hypothetical protein
MIFFRQGAKSVSPAAGRGFTVHEQQRQDTNITNVRKGSRELGGVSFALVSIS